MKRDKIRIVKDYKPWDKSVLELAQQIPVQGGGRIKPFQSWAGTLMLSLHGEKGMKIKLSEDGDPVKITPTAWLLDVIFRPDLGRPVADL